MQLEDVAQPCEQLQVGRREAGRWRGGACEEKKTHARVKLYVREARGKGACSAKLGWRVRGDGWGVRGDGSGTEPTWYIPARYMRDAPVGGATRRRLRLGSRGIPCRKRRCRGGRGAEAMTAPGRAAARRRRGSRSRRQWRRRLRFCWGCWWCCCWGCPKSLGHASRPGPSSCARVRRLRRPGSRGWRSRARQW